MHSNAVPLALTALLSLTSIRAVAVTAVSNLGEMPSSSPLNVEDEQSVAGSFLTGATPMTLDSVGLLTRHIAGATTGFTVALAADDDGTFGGVPGAVLSILDGPDPGSFGTYDYADLAATVLAANTPYWIVASLDPPGASSMFGWYPTFFSSEAGLPGWRILDGFAFRGTGGGWNPLAGESLMFRVETSPSVEAVPEPGTWTAGAVLALVGAAAWRRGRRA